MDSKKRTETHTADLLFTIGLFCVFAAAAFILVMIGIRAYQNTVSSMQDTFSTRTAVSYVAEKIRQHDTAGGVRLGQIDGQTALVLSDQIGGDTYLTYIYSDGETLWELTVRDGTEAAASMGEQILQVRDFSISDAGGGFYAFSAAGDDGQTIRLLIHPRSGG